MLHRDDLQRVSSSTYCPADNRVVERSEIVKGYEYRNGRYVVIEPTRSRKLSRRPRNHGDSGICEGKRSRPGVLRVLVLHVPEVAGRRPYALLNQGRWEES